MILCIIQSRMMFQAYWCFLILKKLLIPYLGNFIFSLFFHNYFVVMILNNENDDLNKKYFFKNRSIVEQKVFCMGKNLSSIYLQWKKILVQYTYIGKKILFQYIYNGKNLISIYLQWKKTKTISISIIPNPGSNFNLHCL